MNNAAWCDAVCRAHGDQGSFEAGRLWWNRVASPPYYPNVVTLDERTGTDDVAPLIQQLLAAGVTAFGVKDSFSRLDLSAFGLSVLFDASWLWRDPAPEVEPQRDGGAWRWSLLRTDDELQAWEAAWWRVSVRAAPALRLFPASLLQAEGVQFLAGYAAGGQEAAAPIAGCALMRSQGVAEVVGVACAFFDEAIDAAAARAEMVHQAQLAHPGVPLVGYDSGDELQAMQALGFNTTGPLRVWLGGAG